MAFPIRGSLPPPALVSQGEEPAENSGIYQEFVEDVRENLPEPEAFPSEIKMISPCPLGKWAAEVVIQSLSREEDEFTYAIKVHEAFTTLRNELSCFEKEEVSKSIYDFFSTLVCSVQRPTEPYPVSELLSLESSVKRIQQSLLLCSAELQLMHSSLSINPFLVVIKNLLIEVRGKISHYSMDRMASKPSSLFRILPQSMVDGLLGHLVPSANATQTKRAFLSLAWKAVKERLESLPNLSSEEATRELIQIILFVHEIEKGEVCHEIEADAHLVTERELILKGAGQTKSGNFLYKVTPAPGSRLCTTHPRVNTFFYKKIELPYAGGRERADFFILGRGVELAKERYEEICQELAKEVKISRQVPDALPIEIVRTSEAPGLLMECIDAIPLEFICHNALPDNPQQLKINTEIALLICKALDRMHKAGYVHLDLDPRHFLIEKKNGSYAIKLIDFRASAPEGGLGKSLMRGGLRSYINSPPELRAYRDYFIAHASMDNWALARILIDIFYGYEIKLIFMDYISNLLDPEDLKRKQKQYPAAYAPFNPDLPPWENIQILVQKFLGTNPEIAAVILPLVHPDPESRGTAGQAADRLQQILGTM